ncbi:M56 family metallopeptidase, partial [uncultured Alistipes sp.]|uniref:M56 family metallopeptidase n=1 Tax=uncultured Alistipes sp. TaxID=538949 RepID=UPI00321FE41C
WFNPIVWLAYVLINKDIELSCDEQVLWKLQDEDKKKYALLLIQLEAVRSNCFPLCNSFCRNLCEERISSIMKIKKLSKQSHMLAVLIVLILRILKTGISLEAMPPWVSENGFSSFQAVC